MKRLCCASVLLCMCAAALALGGDAKDGKDDAKKVVGTWKTVLAEVGGKPLPDDFLKTTTLVLTDGNYKVTTGGKTDEGTWKIDPSKKPRALDITGGKGPNQGKTILAIYELKGDTLRVCYDLSGKERPTEFKTKAGAPLFLAEYKREKP